MRKMIIAVFSTLILVISSGVVMAHHRDGHDQGPSPKITICHHTASESNPTVEIEVSENALAGHQASHGVNEFDTIGPCPNGGDDGDDDDDDDDGGGDGGNGGDDGDNGGDNGGNNGGNAGQRSQRSQRSRSGPPGFQIRVWSEIPLSGVGWQIQDENGTWHFIYADEAAGVLLETAIEFRNRPNEAHEGAPVEFDVPFSALILGYDNRVINPSRYQAYDYDHYLATGELVIVGVHYGRNCEWGNAPLVGGVANQVCDAHYNRVTGVYSEHGVVIEQ